MALLVRNLGIVWYDPCAIIGYFLFEIESWPHERVAQSQDRYPLLIVALFTVQILVGLTSRRRRSDKGSPKNRSETSIRERHRTTRLFGWFLAINRKERWFEIEPVIN